MKTLVAHCTWIMAALVFGQPTSGGAAESDVRLHAGWMVQQDDSLGDVYYLYPDGLFVRQGLKRREFVTIGHWRLEDQKHLVIYDQQLRNTTLSAAELEKIRKKEEKYALVFDSDTAMRWISTAADSRTKRLKRVRNLPDRTENIYWGLGTDESYRRAMLREMGRPIPEKKKAGTSQPVPKAAKAVTPAAAQPAHQP